MSDQIFKLVQDIKNDAVNCDLQVNVIDKKDFKKRMKSIISSCNEIFEILSPKVKI